MTDDYLKQKLYEFITKTFQMKWIPHLYKEAKTNGVVVFKAGFHFSMRKNRQERERNV
jgi:hypothetical protein|tara:strand:- start:268 stop:441 length:174 start_codon:yes stop_codon:yes gene_type:complete